MSTVCSLKSINSSLPQTNKLVIEDKKKSSIEYDNKPKISLLGSTLRSLAEAVIRTVAGCIAFIGYFMTFFCWQQAKDLGLKQIEQAIQAKDHAYQSFHQIFSQKNPKNSTETLKKSTETLEKFTDKKTTTQNKSKEKSNLTKKEEKMEENPIENLPPLLNDPLEIDWVIHPEKSIPQKLQKQFDRAQAQAATEPDNEAFKWLKPPSDFNSKTRSEILNDYEIGVCSFKGRRQHMESQHLVSSFELSIQDKIYPVLLCGIFDGHDGKGAAMHVKNELQHTLHQTILEFGSEGLTDGAIWNALKITCVKLKKTLIYPKAGTTAIFSMILDGKLWVANVGPSRAILDNGIQLSEDAKPATPYYHKGIYKRGNSIFDHRIKGLLSTARSIGDRGIGNMNARPKIISYPLDILKSKNCLILGCDGIYNVSSTRQIAEGVLNNPHESADELAKTIVYSAYQARSEDKLSVLIVKL